MCVNGSAFLYGRFLIFTNTCGRNEDFICLSSKIIKELENYFTVLWKNENNSVFPSQCRTESIFVILNDSANY